MGYKRSRALLLSLMAAVSALTLGSASVATSASAESITPLGGLAKEEYVNPVRPGEPGKAPFWNVASGRFMYAPAFDFKVLEGADRYRFTVAASERTHAFEAGKPYASLAPVWLDIPAGSVTVTVEALSEASSESMDSKKSILSI